MSLAIAFKGPEGIVLAADSRVTLSGQTSEGILIQATYDNATKLLEVRNQKHVGVVTYGSGAFGVPSPPTVNSFLPEFEAHLDEKHKKKRLSVEGGMMRKLRMAVCSS